MPGCVHGFSGRATRALLRATPLWLLLTLSLAGAGWAQPATPPAADGAATAAAAGWTEADIRASRVETASTATLPHKPRWSADPMNLLVVVEAGDAHVSLIDGDRFETVHRFRSRGALHGAPRFSPDGRFAYFGARDGWITRYDLWNLSLAAEVRAGPGLGNLAISRDGRWLMAARDQPPTLVLFDAALNLVKTWQVASRDGQTRSRVSAVLDAAPRQSFIVALQDIPELWEISYDPKVEDFYDGLVHDYRMAEGLPTRGFLNPRRTTIAEPLESLFFDRESTQVAGAARAKDGVGASVQLVNLDVRRRVASLPSAGVPLPGSGTAFDWNGSRVLALPNRERGAIDIIDLRTWKRVKSIATPGPGSFVRGHEGSPYLWADAVVAGHSNGALIAIDKQTLQVAASLNDPGPGLAHVAFTHSGRHVLASLNDAEGALTVFDAVTLKEIKRPSMRLPTRSYNVGNQIKHPAYDPTP